MNRLYTLSILTLSAIALLLLSPNDLRSQEASQLGFTDLQSRANSLVEQGQLQQAIPLLKELIKRVEGSDEVDVELDVPIFLIGTGYIQEYLATGNQNVLNDTLTWFDKLEKDYPQSSRVKEALLKKVDVLRILNRPDEAIELMQLLLSGSQYRLNFSEELKLLNDITQTYYSMGELEAGLPYFGRLLTTARTAENQALAAAASFEAFVDADKLDEAMNLLSYLVSESPIRFRPRLNVAMLRASDKLANLNRLNDAALVLNLIKTTDMMIQYHVEQIAAQQASYEQRKAFNASDNTLKDIENEIARLESTLENLRELPSLESDLLVRRARNYTKSERKYEAFWMFSDLMQASPDDPQIEYFYYAAFSSALGIDKDEAAIEIGQNYREKFADGEYYSDVTVALANQYKKSGQNDLFLALSEEFLTNFPTDRLSGNLYYQWATFLINTGDPQRVIELTTQWLNGNETLIYADGAYYWMARAQLQTSAFAEAISNLNILLEKYTDSPYSEDALLRKGIALFYSQQTQASFDTLTAFIQKYPESGAIDQAYYFKGEIGLVSQDYSMAIDFFTRADQVTNSQDIHDAVAFQVGSIYEITEEYEKMIATFEQYIATYGTNGRLTDAVLELGRGFEFQMRPSEALALYRNYIAQYISDKTNTGVDALIEGYAEKYTANKNMLERTVSFLDRLDNDLEFRTKIVSDRGFLFELFYENDDIHQPLYNNLRNHPDFGPALAKDLSPIKGLTQVYRDELARYPQQSPETYFKELLSNAIAESDTIGEIRALMGLYRIDVTIKPSAPYTTATLDICTPRVILYVADYSRNNNLDFAVEAWNFILTKYPSDNSTVVALLRLSDVSESRNDLGLALNYLEQILTQFPGSPKTPAVILRQGELLTELGRTDEAREKYQYILRVPDWRGIIHARALFQIGESHMADSEYAKAHGFFERTFLGYSQFTEWAAKAYLADADALIKMGSPADALATLNEAIETLPENAPSELITPIKNKLKELQS